MPFGDPANAGANTGGHAVTGSTASDTSTLGFGTTAGNTLVVGVRSGAASGAVTCQVSENTGSTFGTATLADIQRTVASAGHLQLFYFPSLAGGANGAVQVKITQTSASLRYNWCEYTGAFAWDAGTFTDNGAVNAYDSGALVTSATRTLISCFITGINTTNTAPSSMGTTNGLTWTKRNETIAGTNSPAIVLQDFNAGGQAAGTYHGLATLASGTDNIGGEIYSFKPAATVAFIAGAATFVGQGSTSNALVGVATSPTITQAIRRGGYY